MLSNFTEETCTGTGATLALAGATTGNIVFSESFADGDPVAYVVEDSAGTIKVAGVGAYVSASDDITRNDTWNWNGTVIDDSPATNITLSGGTHTVRCDIIDNMAPIAAPISSVAAAGISSVQGEAATQTYSGFAADTLYYTPFFVFSRGVYTELGLEVTANPAGNGRVGVYTVGTDGLPDKLIVDSGSFSTSTTGFKSATITAFELNPGTYYAAMVSDSAIDITSGSGTGLAAMGYGDAGDPSVPMAWKSTSFTFAALPDPAQVTSMTTNFNRPLFVYIGI